MGEHQPAKLMQVDVSVISLGNDNASAADESLLGRQCPSFGDGKVVRHFCFARSVSVFTNCVGHVDVTISRYLSSKNIADESTGTDYNSLLYKTAFTTILLLNR
jgi:hypothetical protein